MPLLSLISAQAVDEEYLAAAERRAAGAPRPPPGRPRRTAAVVVMVFGVLAAIAFVQNARSSDVDDASRATLIERIEEQRGRLSAAQQRVATLREDTAELEDSVSRLTSVEQQARVRIRRLGTVAGFVPVTGEGVRVTVTQPSGADPNQEVKDTDLRLVVNGLWAAGAEAVAVDGQRMTARSAIRRSGLAIEVNGVGIAPPYSVEAVGDTRTLAGNLFDTTTGLEFADLAARYGIGYEVDNVSELRLPAGPGRYLRLRSARLLSESSRPGAGAPPPDSD